jgi:hypothetical protein
VCPYIAIYSYQKELFPLTVCPYIAIYKTDTFVFYLSLVRDLARVFPVRNFGDETGDESLTQDGLDKETSELVDTDVMEDGSEETLGVSKTGPLTIAGVPLDHRFGATQGRQFNTNSLNGTADKKHNDQTQLLNDPEAAAAALGYVTQATLQLASILGTSRWGFPTQIKSAPVLPIVQSNYSRNMAERLTRFKRNNRRPASVPGRARREPELHLRLATGV